MSHTATDGNIPDLQTRVDEVDKAVPHTRRRDSGLRRTLLALVGGLYLIHLLLLWKPIDRWISFGEDFATSPAMAGIAAVIAATIGSRALKRQLDHTRDEAVHVRAKETEASWWEKFEWVTDRILPKDHGQKILEKPLALALSTSLLKMSTADFQREAVRGVINHYLAPDDDSDAQKPRSANASRGSESAGKSGDFLHALQEYVKATQGTPGGSGVASTVLMGVLYEIRVREALCSLVSFDDADSDTRFDLGNAPDGVISIGDQRFCIEIKARPDLSPSFVYQVAHTAAGWKHTANMKTVLVTTAEVPPQWRSRNKVLAERWGDSLRIVQWLPEEGAEILVSRILASYSEAEK